ncbi:hypothetical protein [Helicobacter sp. MIT 01-3238]|uniref:hypothetical protein n=1 Tax=Helicobacter sp. MIT 01-3238 TaxID=398627 RepID=UPI000E1E9733|nr:hypothetical protein [Helicobacter sp. MIT 01-3238]RDU55678.1 hypothetical protein CQA40_00185 [Helicobacter sp. MIT 01-3238]
MAKFLDSSALDSSAKVRESREGSLSIIFFKILIFLCILGSVLSLFLGIKLAFWLLISLFVTKHKNFT